MMTDATIAVLATSAVTVASALIAAIVTILTFRKSGKVETKADTIIAQNSEIKHLADGNLSRVANELSSANTRIEGLERLVASMTPQTAPSKTIETRITETQG